MKAVEEYLKPEVASQIKRLDLRAKMIVRGFLQGLHASPAQGFSVEFSEHRRYTPGDDPKGIDWLVYAKTDRYYIKKFESETNLTGYLVLDVSTSMDYTYRQQLTKFDYCICLAAALAYLMNSQQDPVGLMTYNDKLLARVPPRSRRSQVATILAHLTKLKASGIVNFPKAVQSLQMMLKHKSLIMLMSDFLGDVNQTIDVLRRLRGSGHDVIIFHVLDEAEVHFPFEGMVELVDPETNNRISVQSEEIVNQYRQSVADFRSRLEKSCNELRIDYVPLDTSMPYDRALLEYLLSRRQRF
jgi:uncharacterized protein (DUF58 family)